MTTVSAVDRELTVYRCCAVPEHGYDHSKRLHCDLVSAYEALERDIGNILVVIIIAIREDFGPVSCIFCTVSLSILRFGCVRLIDQLSTIHWIGVDSEYRSYREYILSTLSTNSPCSELCLLSLPSIMYRSQRHH